MLIILDNIFEVKSLIGFPSPNTFFKSDGFNIKFSPSSILANFFDLLVYFLPQLVFYFL